MKITDYAESGRRAIGWALSRLPLDDFTLEKVVKTLEEIKANLAPGSYNLVLSAARKLAQEKAIKGEWTVQEYFKLASIRRLPHVPRRHPSMLTKRQILHFMNELHGWKKRALILCAILGLRRAEAAKAKYEDLIEDDSCPFLRVSNPKGGKVREIPITPTLLLALKEREAVDAEYILHKKNGKPLTPKAVRDFAISLGKAVSKNLTAHDLRRTAISTLLASGLDVFSVAKVAGHSDPKMTMRYDVRPTKEIAKTFQGLWG